MLVGLTTLERFRLLWRCKFGIQNVIYLAYWLPFTVLYQHLCQYFPKRFRCSLMTSSPPDSIRFEDQSRTLVWLRRNLSSPPSLYHCCIYSSEYRAASLFLSKKKGSQGFLLTERSSLGVDWWRRTAWNCRNFTHWFPFVGILLYRWERYCLHTILPFDCWSFHAHYIITNRQQ